MGVIKSPKVHAFVVHESSNKSNLKANYKGKGKEDLEQRKEGNSKAFDDSSSSKCGKGKKESQGEVTEITKTI
jgi:hypothetical protein